MPLRSMTFPEMSANIRSTHTTPSVLSGSISDSRSIVSGENRGAIGTITGLGSCSDSATFFELNFDVMTRSRSVGPAPSSIRSFSRPRVQPWASLPTSSSIRCRMASK